jgi:hypothetical protein
VIPSHRTRRASLTLLVAVVCTVVAFAGLRQVPGVSAQAAPAGVTLCRGVNYTGVCQTFTFDVADLRGSVVGDGQASSLLVAPGWFVSLFSGYGFSGACATYYGTAPDLRGLFSGSNGVSSLRVNQGCQSAPVPQPTQPTPGIPYGLQAFTVGQTTITVGWSAADTLATSFQVAYWQYGYSGNWLYAMLPASQTFFTLTALTPGVRYAFEVQACNGGNCSPWSYKLDVTTLQLPPVQPTNLYVTGNLPTALSVAWNDNSDNEANFVVGWWEYGVSTQWNYVWLPANQNYYLLSGLIPGMRYAFIVEAYNKPGFSPWSNQVDVTTNTY